MKNQKTAKRPQLRWVPVVDARGRTHLESVWETEPTRARHVAPAA